MPFFDVMKIHIITNSTNNLKNLTSSFCFLLLLLLCKSTLYFFQLVNCKVRIAGKHCIVGVKVRSNPTNEQNIQNLAILIAVPPDVNGDTMHMSLRGGVWDPMRRMIICSSPFMKSGETIEFHLQFEYSSGLGSGSVGKDQSKIQLPRFPVLVRCDSSGDQLSGVKVEIGGETYYDDNGVGHRQDGTTPFKMNLSTSYRLVHRKI